MDEVLTVSSSGDRDLPVVIANDKQPKLHLGGTVFLSRFGLFTNECKRQAPDPGISRWQATVCPGGVSREEMPLAFAQFAARSRGCERGITPRW